MNKETIIFVAMFVALLVSASWMIRSVYPRIMRYKGNPCGTREWQ